MLPDLWLILRYEILLIYRQRTDILNPLLFFVLIIVLFPLAITPDLQKLGEIAPGIIWIASLLAVLLSFERLFCPEYQDGSLTPLLLSPYPLSVLVAIKLLAHGFMLIIPLIIITPVLAIGLHLPWQAFPALLASLLLGTPTLLYLGAIAKALTVGLRQSSLLVILLIVPFYTPILIFGTSAVMFAAQGLNYASQLAWLTCFLILALALSPIAIAAALRIGAAV